MVAYFKIIEQSKPKVDNTFDLFDDCKLNPEYRLCKIDLDGNNKNILSYYDVNAFCISKDGNIYYSSRRCNGIFKTDTDFKETLEISSMTAGEMIVSDNCILFSNQNDENYLYKLQIHEGTLKRLTCDFASCLNLYNNKIIYSDSNGHICMIGINGGKKSTLYTDFTSTIIVRDRYIYFNRLTKSNHIFRIKMDGTDIEEVIPEDILYFDVSNDYIYYPSSYYYDNLYNCCLTTGEKTQLNELPVYDIKVRDDYVFYCSLDDFNQGIYKIKKDVPQEKLLNPGRCKEITFHLNSIYFLQEFLI